MLAFMHSSGGLGYHLRSLRYKQNLWSGFAAHVKKWLNAWAPTGGKNLLLIGPSGGYTLPAPWLRQFNTVYVLEPDPIARYLFKNYNSPLNIKFLSDNALSKNAVNLNQVVAANLEPGDHILFSNVLGQMHLINGKSHNTSVLNVELNKLHAKYKVGSYHDRVSVVFPPNKDTVTVFETQHYSARLSNTELITTYFKDTNKLEFQDHGTADLFTEKAPQLIEYAPWPLTPGRIHLIEWLGYS